MHPDEALIRSFRVRGTHVNLRELRRSMDRLLSGRQAGPVQPGYLPPVVSYHVERPGGDGTRELRVREIDVPLLCQRDPASARHCLFLILRSRSGDGAAREQLDAEIKRHFEKWSQQLKEPHLVESRYVVPSVSTETYPPTRVSDKGSILLRLSKLGHPVPDFVIVTAEAHKEWEQCGEKSVTQALENLAAMTGCELGSSSRPLIFAMRSCMPYYVPGFMPTYLNVGVTESVLPALGEIYGQVAAHKILLNNLKNLLALVDPRCFEQIKGKLSPHLEPHEVSRFVDQISDIVRQKDSRLLTDPYHQTLSFVRQAHQHYEQNADILITLSRGNTFFLSLILQQMVCSVRDSQSYAGVLFSRSSKTGTGHELQSGHNIFGEEIMTGTIEPEETAFEDRAEIEGSFPAVYHFVQSLRALEREFESPVTIEFAVEASLGHEFFALLQLNNTAMTGRAAFISVVDLHKEGTISRKRVTELVCPYHVKQIESDTIDAASFSSLDLFCHGVSILPRRPVCGRIYFSTEAALSAKRRGETVCLCKRTFEPTDTVVMREMDGIVSLTAAAIHVVTICQSFGMPGLLSLERFGVSLEPEGRLVNEEGEEIREGEWITISSRRQILYRGQARFKSARLIRFMEGKPVNLAEGERQSFEEMAYAYRYYQQLVRGMKLDQISKLNELIRLVNLELRGEVQQARSLVLGWFDGHEVAYVEEVLRSDLGDHLNQHTVFDMLTLERKIKFFKHALAKCNRERIHGYAAGAFMLGRFLSRPHPVAFWSAFEPLDVGLLVNEWVLFQKYMQVLHEVGERRVVRAKKKILQEGLDNIILSTWNVKCLIPLKLSRMALDAVRQALPGWIDSQTDIVLQILERPYCAFFDFKAEWSIQELEKICAEAGIPRPGPDDT